LTYRLAPAETTNSIILSSNKIQNDDILAPDNAGPPGKMAIKPERENATKNVIPVSFAT